MPELSRFFGVVIGMYYREHGAPHFHATYGNHRASVEVESKRIHGTLPPRVERMVLEWAHLHRAELIENWHRAKNRLPIVPIPPWE
jgi:hypothetical protein